MQVTGKYLLKPINIVQTKKRGREIIISYFHKIFYVPRTVQGLEEIYLLNSSTFHQCRKTFH